MKPAWLNKKISLADCVELKSILKGLRINTVCQEALCPNIGECFAKRQATFIILGSICTRGCRFCAVNKGLPLPLDYDEPMRVAEAVKRIGLKHVVITSVTRDDLSDGGVSVFIETIRSLRSLDKDIVIETLIPDFKADDNSLRPLLTAQPDIIAHNMETVERLYKEIRPGGSDYKRSLDVLRKLNQAACGILLKSGIMVGLGEEEGEVYQVFDDLLSVGCSLLSIGQYLSPSKEHFPVREYIKPEVFQRYKEEALSRGFRYVKSGPYVRSSYLAADYSSALN
jgi:lipoic acid synthetase